MLANNIKAASAAKGISIKTLAQLSGVHYGTLLRIAQGKTTEPKGSTLDKIAEVLEVETDDLRKGTFRLSK